MSFRIRTAHPADAQIIYELIYQLAIYEKLENEVVATPEALQKQIFEEKNAHVLIAEENESPVGFALYFYNFSTFLGRPGLYLEDLFVEPAHRGKGYGKALLRELARIAHAKNCGRMEWSVLKWNQPAIDFYRSLGAKPQNEWDVYRLTADGIANLAGDVI